MFLMLPVMPRLELQAMSCAILLSDATAAAAFVRARPPPPWDGLIFLVYLYRAGGGKQKLSRRKAYVNKVTLKIVMYLKDKKK
jgi:hypothetical protein